MRELGAEAFCAAYSCVRSISINGGGVDKSLDNLGRVRSDSSNTSNMTNVSRVSSGSTGSHNDDALLAEFASIVGVEGMQYLASFFTLVTEEERLSQAME
jgi:hypothetical protein